MPRLPKVVTSSVVRSAQQGESHGGVYVVDLESEQSEQVINWNDDSISWEGRGSDRGLRGIAFHDNKVYLAASDEIFIYDPDFHLLESFRNQYLRHCHEIDISNTTLYLTSTGVNSVLEYDLIAGRFTRGYQVENELSHKPSLLDRIGRLTSPEKIFSLTIFDPNSANGPVSHQGGASLHLNNVRRQGDRLMISGTRTEALLVIRGNGIEPFAPLPRGAHNAMIYEEGMIYNDTASDRIVISDKGNNPKRTFEVPFYDVATLTHTDVPDDHARQGFARGLCLFGDDLIIGGSSPSTISVYSIAEQRRLKSINISKDIRNCIHGLEVWPF